MGKIRLKKKRRFKYRLIGYAFIMFLGYQFSYNVIMHFKLESSNEGFIKALLVDSNYSMLYEKKASNLFTRGFSKILNVNEPTSILDNIFHLKSNDESSSMAYVSNPLVTPKTDKEPLVYLYNTHQGETYLGNGLEGYNIVPGVMMASYIMQNKLSDSGVNSVVMEDNLIDYMNINNMKYSKSYLASRSFLSEAIKYKNYKLIIDIHRDSISHEKSTTIINNKSCAKILFVIGEEYSSSSSNLSVANKVNDMIKEKFPSITRGIITKGGKGNNGVYNQDLNPNIILMEIGSDSNTIDEVLNTIELISPIIGEYVNGQ